MVRDIANTTCVDVAIEEHRYVAIDRRAADGASLAVTSRLKRLPKRRHARLHHEENEAARRSMNAGGFAMQGPDGGQYPVQIRLLHSRAPPQRKSRVKIDAGAAVNSGTGCNGVPQEPAACLPVAFARSASVSSRCPSAGPAVVVSMWAARRGFYISWPEAA
jgi:hypothetical protein